MSLQGRALPDDILVLLFSILSSVGNQFICTLRRGIYLVWEKLHHALRNRNLALHRLFLLANDTLIAGGISYVFLKEGGWSEWLANLLEGSAGCGFPLVTSLGVGYKEVCDFFTIPSWIPTWSEVAREDEDPF